MGSCQSLHVSVVNLKGEKRLIQFERKDTFKDLRHKMRRHSDWKGKDFEIVKTHEGETIYSWETVAYPPAINPGGGWNQSQGHWNQPQRWGNQSQGQWPASFYPVSHPVTRFHGAKKNENDDDDDDDDDDDHHHKEEESKVVCKFDDCCRRTNPSHFRRFEHPKRDMKYATTVSTHRCCFDDQYCTNTTPAHSVKYAHPLRDKSKHGNDSDNDNRVWGSLSGEMESSLLASKKQQSSNALLTTREPCMYDKNSAEGCISTNPLHFKKYCHPNRDAKYATNVTSGTCCFYDKNCNIKESGHFTEYAHPVRDGDLQMSVDGSGRKTVAPPKVAVVIGDSTVYVKQGEENNIPAVLKDPKIVGVRGTLHETIVGYHVTSSAIADIIIKDGFRPSSKGALGPGIYFGKSKKDCYYKAQSNPKNAYLKCECTLGKFILVNALVGNALNQQAVNYAGCTGIYRKEVGKNDEWVIYDRSQYRILEKGLFDIATET